jgi:hypothetical protein
MDADKTACNGCAHIIGLYDHTILWDFEGEDWDLYLQVCYAVSTG